METIRRKILRNQIFKDIALNKIQHAFLALKAKNCLALMKIRNTLKPPLHFPKTNNWTHKRHDWTASLKNLSRQNFNIKTNFQEKTI